MVAIPNKVMLEHNLHPFSDVFAYVHFCVTIAVLRGCNKDQMATRPKY